MMNWLYSFLCSVVLDYSSMFNYLKLYALFTITFLLYKPKVLAAVLFFVFVYFFFIKKKSSVIYNPEDTDDYVILFKLPFLNNEFYNDFSDSHDFKFTEKKIVNFFSNPIVNFFLMLFTSIFFFVSLYYFFLCGSYDYSALSYFSNWSVYSCQLLSVNFDWLIYLDSIAIYFIILTSFIFFLVFLNLFSLKFKKDYIKSYSNTKLLLIMLFYIEFCLILTFSTSNIFFFFFFFEASLVPLYLLVQVWGRGQKKKQYAMFSLLFFTLTGSIFLLCGILLMFTFTGCVDFRFLCFEKLDLNNQVLLFFLFFLGFAFKAPMFPFYSWLPEAHVEASTSVSILLAAIFLKIASYGILRIVLFNLSEACFYFSTAFTLINVVSIFVVFFLALIQTDLKKIVALSSIAHMNYIIIGLMTCDAKAILGSLIYMGAHAFISTALFMLIGALYDNTDTRDLLNLSNIKSYGGKWSFFFFLFNIANVSFPGFVSFFCELVIFNNLAFYSIFVLIFLVFALFFSTIYTFWIIHNVLYGKILKKDSFLLSKNDVFSFTVIFFAVFLFGLFPFLLLKSLEQSIYVLLIKSLYYI